MYTFLFAVAAPKFGLATVRGAGKPPKVKSRGKRNELSRSVGRGLQSKFGSFLIRTCGDMPPRFDSCLMAFGFISDAVERLLLDAIFQIGHCFNQIFREIKNESIEMKNEKKNENDKIDSVFVETPSRSG